MSGKPILTEALKLAEQGGLDWESLLARMEQPKPWDCRYVLDYENMHVGGQKQVWKCMRCGKRYLQDARDVSLPRDQCPVPDPVAEPLPRIVDRKMREIRNWHEFTECIQSIRNQYFGLRPQVVAFHDYWHWFQCVATPAQQLVCLWAAEGLLLEQDGPRKENNMSETQHTPTPYVSGRTGDADQRGDMLIMADLGNGRIESIGRLVNSHHKAVANAAFIVLACNAYDELVAACRAYRTLIVTVQERLIQYLCPDGSNDSDEVINDILGILDGPAWRAVDETGLATLAPVEKGDSSDPARTQR